MSCDELSDEVSEGPDSEEEYEPEAKPERAPTKRTAQDRKPRGRKSAYLELDDFDWDEFSDSEADEVPKADMHDDACSKCGKAGTLVCCDGCERAYHRSCASPPLREVPPVWYCPFCAPIIDLDANMERILAARPLLKAPKNALARKDIEYYVKWRDRAHIHCSWVSGPQMEAAVARSTGRGALNRARLKLQAFERAQVHGEANADPDLVFGVNPAWQQVDRIMAERTAVANAQEVTEVLVKWRQLGYELATWERLPALEKVDGAEAELARLHALQPIADEAEQLIQEEQQAKKQPKRGRKAASVEAMAPQPPEKRAREFKETPSFLKGGNLYTYQLEGLNWLVSAWRTRHNVILADEMGLGKTVQTIAYIAAMHALGVGRPALVVVPLSTLPNWAAELATWAPHLNVVALHGNDAARKAIKKYELYAPLAQGAGRATRAGLQARVQFHVLISTYEMVVAEAAELRPIQWQTLVVDEAHRLRRSTSRLFVELASINAVARVALSGTPLQNNIEELFQLLAFLDPVKFGGGMQDMDSTYGHLAEAKQVEELHGLLRPHLLRRLKADVLGSLPPKKEQIVRVELAAPQRALYKSLLTNSYKTLISGGSQSTAKNNLLMQLRKCCVHPSLLSPYPGIEHGQTLAEYVAASGKLALLDQMVGLLRERGHRILIYSQFTMLLDVLEDWLHQRKWPFFRLDGTIGSQDRQKRIEAFNAPGAKVDVFLLSTRAGGQGINLATADTVVLFDSDFNPHNDMQALARAHRLGQTRPVMIYRLVARSTVEEYIIDKARGKLVINHMVFSSLDERLKGGAKGGELDEILKYGARRLFEEDEKAEGAENGKAVPEANAQQNRKETMSAREAAAGRMGGGGRRIVYDSAAIEALLDRSGLEKGTVAGDADEPQSDFMKSFKVAQFDYAEEPEAEAEPEAPAGEQDGAAAPAENGAAAPAGNSRHFWDGLIKDEHQQAEAMALAAMGKGKRQRRRVDYSMGGGDEADDEDFSMSSDEGSSSGSDQEATVPEQRVRKRQRFEEPGGRDKPIVNHLAAVVHDIVGWPAVVLQPRSPAMPHHGPRLPLLPAPAALQPPLGPQLPPLAAAVGAYLPAGQLRPTTVFSQVAATLQPGAAAQPSVPSGQHLTQLPPAAASPAFRPHMWQPPGAQGLPPLKRMVGRELRILDLGDTQRRKFLRTMMFYGIDTLVDGAGFDWQRFRTALGARDAEAAPSIKAPSVKAVDAYGQLLVDIMNTRVENEQSEYFSAFFGESVQRQDLLFGSLPQEIMTRLGQLKLIHRKIEECGGEAGRFRLAHPPQAPKPSAQWTQDHDRRLLVGILRHGFGRWKPIADDRQLDLKPQLRVELAALKPLPLIGRSAATAAGAAGAAPALAPANGVANPSDAAAAVPASLTGVAGPGDGAAAASDAAGPSDGVAAGPDTAGTSAAATPAAGNASQATPSAAEHAETARKAEAAIHARERQWLEKRAMALSDVLHREYYPTVQQSAPVSRSRLQHQAAAPPHALPQQHLASSPQQRQTSPAGGSGRMKQQNIMTLFVVGGSGPALPQQQPRAPVALLGGQAQQMHVQGPTQLVHAQQHRQHAAQQQSQFKSIPLETTAGDNVAERAGRLRIAELHNSLCNGVLAVRAGARAAHKSAAGAGAAAVEAAAQSFQRNMQDMEGLAGEMLHALAEGSAALPKDYLATAERASRALLGAKVTPLPGPAASPGHPQTAAQPQRSPAVPPAAAATAQRSGSGHGQAAAGTPNGTTATPPVLPAANAPPASGQPAAAAGTGVGSSGATTGTAKPAPAARGEAAKPAAAVKPAAAAAAASGGASAKVSDTASQPSVRQPAVPAATGSKRRGDPLATPAKRPAKAVPKPPAAAAGASGPAANPKGGAKQPSEAISLQTSTGTAAKADDKQAGEVNGPAGAARRRALASPQKPQYQDVIVLSSSDEED